MIKAINGLVALVCAVAFISIVYALYAVIGTSLTTKTLTEHDVSLEQAMAAADGAIAECKKGNSVISVVVVDRIGGIRLLIRGTGQTPDMLDQARRKAYTARTFRATSAAWADRTKPDAPQAGQRKLVDVDPDAGGVPIIFDGEGIGGIGVAGSKGGPMNDEACAKAGLAKIADQLL